MFDVSMESRGSQRHESKDILTRDDAFKGSSSRIGDTKRAQVEVSEEVIDFLQLVSCLGDKRSFNHVGSNVNHPVLVHLADFSHLFVLSIVRVEVAVEEVIGQFITCLGNGSVICQTSELCKSLLPLDHLRIHISSGVAQTHCLFPKQNGGLPFIRLSHF